VTGRRYLLGIDIGTSGVRAAIFDEDGNLVSLGRRGYEFQHPHPGWSELDAEEVWQKTIQATRESIAQGPVAPERILAIGLSAPAHSSIPVDENCRPVYPAIQSIDRRDNGYEHYLAWFRERFGAEAIFKRSSFTLGSLTPPILPLLWLRDHRPDVFSRIRKSVLFQDFAVWRLTGTPALDYSMASGTMVFDPWQQDWIDEFLDAAGITREFFSPLSPSAQPVGMLKEDVAREIGLPAGTMVVPGAHDLGCAAIAVGLSREGMAADVIGSFEALATVVAEPVSSLDMLRRGQASECHAYPGLYLAVGFSVTAGSLIRWYAHQLCEWEREQACQQGKDPYDLITEAASTSPPGARGLLVLPHWSGAGTGRIPPLNADSRGAILGLNLSHTKADLSRAVFEGIAYEARIIIESMESSGLRIDELVATGGGAKSRFLLQLKADVTGKQVVLPRVAEASLLGAAMLAGVGAGVYADVAEAISRVSRIEAVFEPVAATKRLYDERFTLYRELYQTVVNLSARL
jgi:xylulokinase